MPQRYDREALRGLVGPVAVLVQAAAPEIDVGRALIDLRGRVDGQWMPALRLIWPCVRNPRARAHEAMDAARAAAKAELAAGGAESAEANRRIDSSVATLPQNDRIIALSEDEGRRYRLVAPLVAMRGAERRAGVQEIAAAEHVSETTVYNWVQRAKAGTAGLRRRRRSDAGSSGLPDGAKQMLIALVLSPRTRKVNLIQHINRVREEFPEAGEAALRHVARHLPPAAKMSREEYNKRFMPTGEWVAPYPNHSWSFDYTIADMTIWDGDGRVRPYRPWVTAMVDEATGAPVALLYTREHPDRYALRSVLLMAVLPKGGGEGTWPQHGLPERLHGDNGKIQRSIWLADVCRQIGINLDVTLDLTFSNAYESWQNGHIESFWKDLHAMLESRFAEVGAYCGRSPEDKPEGYIGDSARLSDWRKLPCLADLNRAAQAWICAEYLTRHHSRLGMSRNDAWRLHADGHVNLPDEGFLRQALMVKERRKVAHARVQLNGLSYWSERLIDYDGLELAVWWDAAHLDRVLIFDAEGRQICWANVERPHELGDTDSLAEYRRKRAAALAYRRNLNAMIDQAGEHLPAATVAGIVERLEQQAIPAGATANLPLPAVQRLHARPAMSRAADEGVDLLAARDSSLAALDRNDKAPDLLGLIAGAQTEASAADDLLPPFAAETAAPLPDGLTFHGIEIGPAPEGGQPSAPTGNDLPASFVRWFNDRYGPYGDAPRQPAALRKAAKKQVVENYATAGVDTNGVGLGDGGDVDAATA